MTTYRITITGTRESCPFDERRKNKAFCDICKALNNPCTGIGEEKVISSRKIDENKLKQVLKIIK